MNHALIGALCFLLLMILIFHGFPIAIAMFVSSALGFLIINDWNIAILEAQFSATFFNTSASYDFAVLPLFILLGTLAGVTGVAEQAFSTIRTWLGKVKGGTLFTVIVANGIYGACSANSSVGNIIFSRLSMPYLKKEGYDEQLSYGVLCSSGSLASLIPPSQAILTICLVAPAVTYGGKTFSMSLGTGLLCGIVPGILLIILLCLAVRVYGFVKKGTVPPPTKETITWKQRLQSLKFLLPLFTLFFIMIGGASLGWFSTTVAGAIGAFCITIYALLKRVPLKQVFHCFWEACVMQGSIFIIIVAGNTFSKFIAASGLTKFLGDLVKTVQAPPLVLFAIVMVFFLIGGAVMNIVPLIICTSSVVFTVLVDGAGYHPYIVMVCLVLLVEVAQLTPPIGLGTYMVANALRVDPMKIFRAVVPFFAVLFLYTFLLAIVPNIALWLPRMMGYLSV